MSESINDQRPVRPSMKYLHFGSRLWMLREKRGLRSQAMADFLKIPHIEYRRIEAGESIPDPTQMMLIAKTLNVEIAKLIQWARHARHKARGLLDETRTDSTSPAYKLLSEWHVNVGGLRAKYLQQVPENPIDEVQFNRILATLEKDVVRLMKLPVLPMSLFLHVSTVLEQQGKVRYMHELADLYLEGENYASYAARDPYLAPFVCQAANQLFFHEHPASGVVDCFNRLTLDQFKTLLYLAVNRTGIYNDCTDLTWLQQHHEFCALGAVMVRELREVLPKNVNFDDLYAAALMQGLGTHAFFTLLKPSLIETTSADVSPSEAIAKTKIAQSYRAIDDTLLTLINYELHALVCAMLAANWHFPESVIKVLIEHHKQPTDSVSPACAMLKIVNFFVDCDFPSMSEPDLRELLKKYPQIDLPVERLFQVTQKMNTLKTYMVETSSSVIQSKSPQVAQVISKHIKTFKDHYSNPHHVVVHMPPRSSDFRFNQDYQAALVNESYQALVQFLGQFHHPAKNESMANFLKRIEALNLAHGLITLADEAVVEQTYGCSMPEIRAKFVYLV